MKKIFHKKLGFTLLRSVDERKRGFTLIEMMVAVFVFMILFLIAASFVNLAAGSTKSNRTKLLTSDIRNTLDVISQKMNNANGRALDIYGFKVTSDTLGIVNFDGTTNNCTFIKKVNTGIYMKVDKNCSSWPTLTINDQLLTSTSIVVDSVTFSNNSVNGAKPTTVSPYLKIVIIAHDADIKYSTDNVINLQTSYTMDYQTIKRLKNL